MALIPGNIFSLDSQDLEGSGVGDWGATNNCTITQTTAYAHSGTHSLQLSSTAAGDMSTQINLSGVGAVVMGGAVYEVTGWCKAASATRACFLYVNWFDASNTFVSNSFVGGANDSASVETHIDSTTVTAPPTATHGAFGILVQATGGASEIHRFDFLGVLAPVYTGTGSGALSFDGTGLAVSSGVATGLGALTFAGSGTATVIPPPVTNMFYQSASGSVDGGGILAVTYGAFNKAGDLLAISVASWDDTFPVLSVSDSLGNVWQRITPSSNGGQTDGGIWVAFNCKAGANTVTVTIAGSSTAYTTAIIAEFSGNLGVQAAPGVLNMGGSPATSHTSGNTAATVPGCLVLGMYFDEGSGGADIISIADSKTAVSVVNPGTVTPLGFDYLLSSSAGVQSSAWSTTLATGVNFFQGCACACIGPLITVIPAGTGTWMGGN